jgi:rare lipoprotein A
MLKLKKLCVCGVAAMSLGTPFKAALAQCGTASWYHEGARTATGERYNPDGITAAHRSLPFGTRVEVRNQRTGRSVVVRINDRGPYIGGRIIDLSRGAKKVIGMDGLASVCLAVLGRDAPMVASADRTRTRTAAVVSARPRSMRSASVERRTRSAVRITRNTRVASPSAARKRIAAAEERRERRVEARMFERRARISEESGARHSEAWAEGFGRQAEM